MPHNRMPVILDPDGYDLWLDRGMRDVTAAAEMFKPTMLWLMRRYPVVTRINHVANDDTKPAPHPWNSHRLRIVSSCSRAVGYSGGNPDDVRRRSPDRKNLAQVSYAEQSAALFLADPRYCFASAASWTSRSILFCSIRMKPVRGLSMSSNSRSRYLRLTADTYVCSAELRIWCQHNRNRFYVPEWLLGAWGITADPNVSDAA